MDNVKEENRFSCSNHPLLWFVETSYGYVNPRGLLGHIKFIVELPFAAHRFLKSMNEHG